MIPRVEYYNTLRPSHSLNALFAGEEHCRPSHRFGGVRDYFLYHYILEGEGTVRIGRRSWKLTRGGGFLFFPGQRHLYKASERNPWHYTWVGFSGTHAHSILSSCGVSPDTCVFTHPFFPDIPEQFSQLIQTLRHRASGFSLRADGLLYIILSSLKLMNTAPTARQGEEKQGYVDAARQFIQMNYQRHIMVEDIAAYIGLERAYLSSIFSKATGTTLKRYLTEYRMTRARELLEQTEYSIREVGASVGYGDYPTFAKRFRHSCGMSPGEYRNVRRARR